MLRRDGGWRHRGAAWAFALGLVLLHAAACGDGDGAGGGGATGSIASTSASTTSSGASSSSATSGAGGSDAQGGGTGDPRTPGCGMAPERLGTFETEIESSGKQRRLTVTVPESYDPAKPYRLVVGYHGRDYDGTRMRDYLRLETAGDPADSIFVYPWGGEVNGFIGWQLGAYGGPFGGPDDLVFFDDMMTHLKNAYCLDTHRVFVTGQSWGGDMTHLVTCFRGDVVRAGVGVAANGDYYLPPEAGECRGNPDIYTLHGVDDGSIPFAQGLACRDFWAREHGCGEETSPVAPDPCVAFSGCSATTLFCPYGPNNGGHQVPDWYPETTMAWFRSY